MSRKGMALAKVAVGILILSLLIVLLFFLFKSSIRAASLAEDSECQSSILAHTTLIKVLDGDVVPDITCPTKYYTITSSDEEKIQNYLAESMKSCWGTWGRGELELFKEEGAFCHVCSVIDFKKKGLEINDFQEYLATHKLQSGPFKGFSYLQYLGSAYKGDLDEVDDIEKINQNSDNVINTDSTYAAVFLYAKGEEDLRRLYQSLSPIKGEAGTMIGGGVLGGLVGGAVGVALCLTGVGCAIVVASVVGATVGAILGKSVSKDIGWAAVTLLRPYDAESLKALGCEELPVKHDMHNDRLG